jgi:hypothetical protein
MSESSLQLQLEGYEGPLDLLLELARSPSSPWSSNFWR